METLAGLAQKAGFFRPIIGGGRPDAEIELIRGRYRLESSYEEMHALRVDEAHGLIARGHHEELEQRAFDAYKELEPLRGDRRRGH